MFPDKTLEEYQLLLLRNPSSRVFAPLAESYRKMGLLQQALELCEKGVKYNPHYPSGFVAYGKILFELQRFEDASLAFEQATLQQNDNILAHKLRAMSLSKLGLQKEALQAYKKVLFLNPKDHQAEKFVANWEYLEAADYSEKSFNLDSQEKDLISESDPIHVSHFIDALIVRNELERAHSIVETSLCIWPQDPLLEKQQSLLHELLHEGKNELKSKALKEKKIKKDILEQLLQRIESRKQESY